MENMKSTIKNIQDWRKGKLSADFKTPAYPSKVNFSLPPENLTTQSDIVGLKSAHTLPQRASVKSFVPSTFQNYERFDGMSSAKSSPIKLPPMISDASRRITEIINAATPNPKAKYLPKLDLQINSEEKRRMVDEQLYSEKYLNTVKSAFLPIMFSPIEEKYPSNRVQYPEFAAIFGKQGVRSDGELYTEPDDSIAKKLMTEQSEKRVQANNTKVMKVLFEEIDSNDDQLKFEYIQMVKNGKEDEHMTYLLQDPSSNRVNPEMAFVHEKMKLQHQQVLQEDVQKAKEVHDNIEKVKRAIQEKSTVMSSELLQNISTVYQKSQRFVEQRANARKPAIDNTPPVI